MLPPDSVWIVVSIFLTLLLLGVGVLLGTVVLRAAAKWADNLDLAFWPAAGTVMVYSLAEFGLGLIVAMLAGMMGSNSKQALLQGLAAPVGFLVQSAVISGRHHLSLGKGIKISIFMWLVSLVIAIGVAIVAAGLLLVMPRF